MRENSKKFLKQTKIIDFPLDSVQIALWFLYKISFENRDRQIWFFIEKSIHNRKSPFHYFSYSNAIKSEFDKEKIDFISTTYSNLEIN